MEEGEREEGGRDRRGEMEGEGREEGEEGGGGRKGGRDGERGREQSMIVHVCVSYTQKVEPESFTLAVEYKTLSEIIHLKLKDIKRIDMCTSSSSMAIIIHLPDDIYKREIMKLEAKFRFNNFWSIKGTLTSSYSVILYTL